MPRPDGVLGEIVKKIKFSNYLILMVANFSCEGKSPSVVGLLQLNRILQLIYFK
jgi:hypothetical protein